MGEHLFVVERTEPQLFDFLRHHIGALERVEVVLDRRHAEQRHVAVPERRRVEGSKGELPRLTCPGFVVISRSPSPGHHVAVGDAPRPVVSVPEVASFLEGVRLFNKFTRVALAVFACRLREHRLKAGRVVFHEGERGEAMFVARRGTIVISKTIAGRLDAVLSRVGPGEVFGEMSLLARLPRSASAQAETDADLLVVDRDAFECLIRTNPDAMVHFFTEMVQAFIERLRATNDLVAEVTRWGLEATGIDVGAT